MPAKSPEALRRKAANRRAKRQAKIIVVVAPKLSNVARRRLMPKLPDMSKAALRAMLTAAVINTGAANADQA
jgi:hypothetical protein